MSVGEPLTTKGRATRDRILDATAELMHERGVAQTSMGDVRVAAGVSSSQLYHYFADKRAIVAAVIVHQTERIVGSQEPRLVVLDDLPALRAWRDGIVALTADRGGRGGCPLGSLAAELSDADDGHRAALAGSFARWEEAIRDGLSRMRDRGEIAPDADVGELALALLAALQGGLLLGQLRRSPAPVRAGLDAVIDRIALAGQGSSL